MKTIERTFEGNLEWKKFPEGSLACVEGIGFDFFDKNDSDKLLGLDGHKVAVTIRIESRSLRIEKRRGSEDE